ncbi:hypothetical protein CC80DRAFT_110483 [Byssothecium circinans]|uniref:Uncharacterized protein n=1 Tax=Byssothecium circinans TaxID=147558 RepID=A0A6A5TWE1_9PLEO|nr:hypothetical protein CC80DRAFT_110483 [Byssothecium circinans]
MNAGVLRSCGVPSAALSPPVQCLPVHLGLTDCPLSFLQIRIVSREHPVQSSICPPPAGHPIQVKITARPHAINNRWRCLTRCRLPGRIRPSMHDRTLFPLDFRRDCTSILG